MHDAGRRCSARKPQNLWPLCFELRVWGQKIKVLECPEMARFAITIFGSRRVGRRTGGSYPAVIVMEKYWNPYFLHIDLLNTFTPFW